MSDYETIVGLEIHVELATLTKAFCACTADFGGAPNTQVCPVCMGLPGALPVLNEQAVAFAVSAGLALGCAVTPNARFDRKHYFYPDLPKAYQISQLHLPLCRDGFVDIPGKRVRIREIHMEEDAGKLIHDPWTNATLVDYNRCGIPLIEIVSEPDLRTPEEVVAYVDAVRAILQTLGVSDCKMQEGSLRVDVNLSVRRRGESALGTRTEMKNLNSRKAIARAVAGEAARQVEEIELGRCILQQTRRWDDNKETSFAMRTKEDAHDYRYFPDPDLPPLALSPEWIAERHAALPELPDQKRSRYPLQYGLSAYDTDLLTQEPALSRLFERAEALCSRPKDVANWILGEVLALLKERGEAPDQLRLVPEKLAQLIEMQAEGRINRNAARAALQAALASDVDVASYIKEHGLEMLGDEALIKRVVDQVLAEQPDTVASYQAGKEKAFGFLMGQAMRKLGGKADPALLKAQLSRALLSKSAKF